jgi:hypothetical protein
LLRNFDAKPPGLQQQSPTNRQIAASDHLERFPSSTWRHYLRRNNRSPGQIYKLPCSETLPAMFSRPANKNAAMICMTALFKPPKTDYP